MKKKCLIALAWLALWYLLDLWIGNDILFAGPVETISALLRLGGTAEFWRSVAGSLLRILGGCLLGGSLAVLLGAAAFRWRVLDDFLAPLVSVVKAVPVVSFVILVLIWAGNRWVALVVSSVIVFPIIYLNTKSGLAAAGRELPEMAAVFRMPFLTKIRRIWWVSLRTHLSGAASAALGMGFRGGVSAEVIGQPLHSIGNSMYRAKIVLSTDEVFAWSAVTILLSVLLGKGLGRLIRWLEKR